ncbi:MAG TPA: hypothetical protein VI248_09140, partial [Kineosporiaceae bacterium]
MTGDHGPFGAPLADDELGRLIAEGLARRVAGPVDERALVAGARAGAVRIRRRRSAGAALVALVVLALPAGLLGSRLLGGGERDTSTAAGSARSATGGAGARSAPMTAGDGVAAREARGDAASASAASAQTSSVVGAVGGPAAPAPSPLSDMAAPSTSPGAALQRATASPAATVPPPLMPVPLARTASGAVAIPGDALLGAADLSAVTTLPLRPTSDTANTRPAAAVSAAQVCGRAPTGGPSAEGSRSVTFEQAPGATSGWLIGSTVRVFRGTAAARYLVALTGQQRCLATAVVADAGSAAIGHGAVDA